MDSFLEFPRVEKNAYAERVKMQRILLANEFARCTTVVIPRGMWSFQAECGYSTRNVVIPRGM